MGGGSGCQLSAKIFVICQLSARIQACQLNDIGQLISRIIRHSACAIQLKYAFRPSLQVKIHTFDN
jgi:hypothetical protein